jgi:hypothetical protein
VPSNFIILYVALILPHILVPLVDSLKEHGSFFLKSERFCCDYVIFVKSALFFVGVK